MAWQTVKYRLTSSAPLIMHNGQTADPLNKWNKLIKTISSKRTKTDADHEEIARLEFFASQYIGEDKKPIIPQNNIEGMVQEAATKFKEKKLAKAGVFSPSHATIEYDGPNTVEGLWLDERFRITKLVRIQSSHIVRTRPIFQRWQAIITLNIEDTVVDVTRVTEWLIRAGQIVGLGDWRPQYGRFTVELLK